MHERRRPRDGDIRPECTALPLTFVTAQHDSRFQVLSPSSLAMAPDPKARQAALFRYVELFLDEVESRGRELDPKECEWLAEVLVRLGAGQTDCEHAMRQLEMLLATDLPLNRRPHDPSQPTIAEYRELVTLLRSKTR